MTVGEKIKFLRKHKGITQGELAKELNVSKSTIAMYEINKNSPSVEMLLNLCMVLGTTGDYLIGLSDIPFQHNVLNDLSNILNRIKTLKKERGFTNETLAKASGVPKSTLDKILSGIIKAPSVMSINKIANALSISTDALSLTEKEGQLIQKYRDNLSMQKAVDTLLGIE